METSHTKIAVIGTGLVGATYAYTAVVQGLASEVCLIDVDQDKARGHALDLAHTAALGQRCDVWAGTIEDASGADVVMISAGFNQKPGQTRLDLISQNAEIVGDIAREVGKLAPSAVLLVTTNPVDVMAYVVMKESGAWPSRVIGSGTALDTVRLRFLIGERLGVDPRSVHAFVLGEHGDSEVVAWSRAQVAGTPLGDWPQIDEFDRQSIEDDVRNSAYQVIRLKGATYYAIALTLAKITEAILKDSRTVFSVSAYLEGEYGISGVYLGVPAVIGRSGVLETIETPLSPEELSALRESAEVVRRATRSLELEASRGQLDQAETRSPARAFAMHEASAEPEVPPRQQGRESGRGGPQKPFKRPRPPRPL